MKKWILAKKISNRVINKFPEIHPVVLQLLSNRGLTSQEKIDEFLMPDYSQDIHDPFLFQDMRKAVERIIKAIEKKEKILVYGDYDVDGVCSAVLLVDSLKNMGAVSVDVYIPDRETEGYGLNKEAIKEIAKEKTNLLITCDCGITSKEEIVLANDLGIEVIITDHHCQPPELPDKALAIINPKLEKEKYPFKDLAGVGVAFKLIQALLKDERIKIKNKEAFEKWLLDLVALGTVADCMPLLGENRTLVKYGLIVLNKSRRIGLRELIGVAGLDKKNNFNNNNNLKKLEFSLDTYNIAFQLGPRINAAGRMNHASTAYRLLVTQDKEGARRIAFNLNQTNKERQKLVEKIFQEAKKQIGKVNSEKKILFALGEHKNNWLAGLIGLIAGKICENYYRPAIVMSETEKEIIGSGRSIPEFDITNALEKSKKYLARFGGHKGACGFTLKKKSLLKGFKNKLRKIAQEELRGKELMPSFLIDVEIKLNEIDWKLYEDLKKFEPYGEGNLRPKFLTKNLQILGIERVGQEGQHLRLFLQDDEFNSKKFISFNSGDEWGEKLKIGDRIDVVYEMSVNLWNGSKELQLKIIDLRFSKK